MRSSSLRDRTWRLRAGINGAHRNSRSSRGALADAPTRPSTAGASRSHLLRALEAAPFSGRQASAAARRQSRHKQAQVHVRQHKSACSSESTRGRVESARGLCFSPHSTSTPSHPRLLAEPSGRCTPRFPPFPCLPRPSSRRCCLGSGARPPPQTLRSARS